MCVSSGGIDIKQLTQWVKIITKGAFLKFVFFKKATKFDEIFTLLLTNTSFSVFPARLLNFCEEKNN